MRIGQCCRMYFSLAKKVIRAISSANHTEPFLKFYNILKLKDIFNYRLLTFCYNLGHNKIYVALFLPNTSIAVNRYHIRQARLQSPLYMYVHEYNGILLFRFVVIYINTYHDNRKELCYHHVLVQEKKTTRTPCVHLVHIEYRLIIILNMIFVNFIIWICN